MEIKAEDVELIKESAEAWDEISEESEIARLREKKKKRFRERGRLIY